MTTYFEHNAGTKEPFEPRKEDVVPWPGIVVTERCRYCEQVLNRPNDMGSTDMGNGQCMDCFNHEGI